MRKAKFEERVVCGCGVVVELAIEGSVQFPLRRVQRKEWVRTKGRGWRMEEIEVLRGALLRAHEKSGRRNRRRTVNESRVREAVWAAGNARGNQMNLTAPPLPNFEGLIMAPDVWCRLADKCDESSGNYLSSLYGVPVVVSRYLEPGTLAASGRYAAWLKKLTEEMDRQLCREMTE